jgi:hypothetical protein
MRKCHHSQKFAGKIFVRIEIVFSAPNLSDISSVMNMSSIDPGKQVQISPEECKSENEEKRFLVRRLIKPHSILYSLPFVGNVGQSSRPTNPQNWTTFRKWTMTIFVSCGGFVTMMSGSMIAPALPSIAEQLHMSKPNAQFALSLFILGFAVGPLILAPFAEIYGRRPIWLLSGAFYSLWNIIAGFSTNKSTFIASRFLSGFAGSIDFVVRE